MIEQNSAGGVQPIGLAVIDRDVMGIELGDRIGAARMKRGLLVLGRVAGIAEQLGGGGLVESGPRAAVAQSLEDSSNRKSGDLAGIDGLLEGGVDETLGRQIVDFVRGHAIEHALDLSGVG